MIGFRKRPAPSFQNTPMAGPTTTPVKLRLRSDATGPDIHIGYYRRDAADALAEIERLEAAQATSRTPTP